MTIEEKELLLELARTFFDMANTEPLEPVARPHCRALLAAIKKLDPTFDRNWREF